MNEAVAALRQEVARSYERTETLSKENDRLRALVTSLQRDLGKSRSENKTLRNQIRALEKRLHEIRTPAPDTAEEPEAAGPPDATGGDFVEPTPPG